jgi:hypothetical protein
VLGEKQSNLGCLELAAIDSTAVDCRKQLIERTGDQLFANAGAQGIRAHQAPPREYIPPA